MRLCGEGLQRFTLVINRAPQGVPLAVDLHENLVQVPSPIRGRTHLLDTFTADFSGKHWAKSIPPIPHRFVADVDAALVQQVLDIAERKGKANVHHDRQADDLRAGLEVAKWRAFCHSTRLGRRPASLKPVLSDKTNTTVRLRKG
jgi:hypothetical protein